MAGRWPAYVRGSVDGVGPSAISREMNLARVALQWRQRRCSSVGVGGGGWRGRAEGGGGKPRRLLKLTFRDERWMVCGGGGASLLSLARGGRGVVEASSGPEEEKCDDDDPQTMVGPVDTGLLLPHHGIARGGHTPHTQAGRQCPHAWWAAAPQHVRCLCECVPARRRSSIGARATQA